MESREYGYSYFCGANILLYANGFPVLEAAGISYNLIDSTVPLYGYSSRLFDAVAPGQVIVQGSLVINFVHHNYLYHCFNSGDTALDRTDLLRTSSGTGDSFASPAEIGQLLKTDFSGLSEENQEKLWEEFAPVNPTELGPPKTPFSDATRFMANRPSFGLGPINIGISFAKRYTIDLLSAYFIGRGSTIQIDENVIVEEYPFFARDMQTRYHNEKR